MSYKESKNSLRKAGMVMAFATLLTACQPTIRKSEQVVLSPKAYPPLVPRTAMVYESPIGPANLGLPGGVENPHFGVLTFEVMPNALDRVPSFEIRCCPESPVDFSVKVEIIDKSGIKVTLGDATFNNRPERMRGLTAKMTNVNKRLHHSLDIHWTYGRFDGVKLDSIPFEVISPR